MQFRKIAANREWNFGVGLGERLFQKIDSPGAWNRAHIK